MDTCKDIVYSNGAMCDYCKKAIGDVSGGIDRIYVADNLINPDKTLRLCQKDYDGYITFLEQERELYKSLFKEQGYNNFTEHQKRMYNRLVTPL
ncbi:hypothetical protein V7247_25900 [Priestia megaterium]|uniref:hypothetical protein n=1 Tax=Priestia megaterium TaxID=1404 RepID=UPI002FFE2348